MSKRYGSCFLLSRIWLCPLTRLCLCSTAVLSTQSPLPTSTLSVSSPLFQPSANTYMRSVLLCVKICACVDSRLSKDPFSINSFSTVLQVIEFRQKESPYLLPEGVFIENPKYVPVKFSSGLSSIEFAFYKCCTSFFISIFVIGILNRINAMSRLPSSLEKVEGDVLFLQSKITEVLGGSGYNTERLATPYVPQHTG